jgi:AcrR family transcriptional regulator
MTRDRIFAAARELFDREGLEGLSIRKVAAAVGLTPMALYRHFADKDALIDALMLDGFQAWEAMVAEVKATTAAEWLEKVFEAYLDFALAQPHRFDAAFLLPARGARRYPDDIAAGRSPVLAQIMAHIDQVKAQGGLGGEHGGAPVFEIALSVSALAQGFVSMHRAGRFADEASLRALYRAALKHAVASFNAPGETR